MRKKHSLSNKLPRLSMLLAFISATIVIYLPGETAPNEALSNLLISGMAVIVLLLQKWWFSPEYKGVFKAEIPLREIVTLSAPYLISFVLTYICNLVDSGLYFAPTVLSLTMAIAAGLCEETAFRGVTMPIGMRYLKSKNRALAVTVLTALIFGAFHLSNIMGGASVTMGVIQAFATAFSGLFLGAVFLRTGSIVPSMILHAVFDWICFTTDATLENGIMAAEIVTPGLVGAIAIDVALGIAGLYLIRPSVREKIEELWQKKWS